MYIQVATCIKNTVATLSFLLNKFKQSNMIISLFSFFILLLHMFNFRKDVENI
jgi:hypothetical protein